MSKRAVRCPGCGRFVVLDDAANIIRHENPMCVEFERRMKASGLTARVEPWVEVVDPTTGAVKVPAKA